MKYVIGNQVFCVSKHFLPCCSTTLDFQQLTGIENQRSTRNQKIVSYNPYWINKKAVAKEYYCCISCHSMPHPPTEALNSALVVHTM